MCLVWIRSSPVVYKNFRFLEKPCRGCAVYGLIVIYEQRWVNVRMKGTEQSWAELSRLSFVIITRMTCLNLFEWETFMFVQGRTGFKKENWVFMTFVCDRVERRLTRGKHLPNVTLLFQRWRAFRWSDADPRPRVHEQNTSEDLRADPRLALVSRARGMIAAASLLASAEVKRVSTDL